MTSSGSLLGTSAEDAACRWLQSAGFRVLARNWRRPWGELDLVASKDDIIHAIEVKASAASRPGFEPFVRADDRKMAKVARTARTWLAANGYEPDTPWQMDVISVIMNPNGPTFELFENI